jgi:dTDP-4-amino-4,6-dideoxygalactose transaminase
MKNKKIKYFDLGYNFKKIQNIFFKEITNAGRNGEFILGAKIKEFENKLKKFTNSKYVVSCANGSDAIELSLDLLGIKKGDEIITTSNTWISIANAIIRLNARPVFVDINKSLNIDPNTIEKFITKKTKCLVVTHLNGLSCDMNRILKICNKHKIKILEDCSQAIGTTYNNIHVGNFGSLGTFSLHPTKNLGLFGDGGFILTNNKFYYKKLIIIRNHGLMNRDNAKYIGRNSRLDTFQAIAGLIKMKKLSNTIKKRIANANLYEKGFNDLREFIETPIKNVNKNSTHTFHRYVILCKKRDQLLKHFEKNNIEVKIHYPINIHQQKPFRKFYKKNLNITNNLNKKILSLPIQENLKKKEIYKIILCVKKFYKKS